MAALVYSERTHGALVSRSVLFQTPKREHRGKQPEEKEKKLKLNFQPAAHFVMRPKAVALSDLYNAF